MRQNKSPVVYFRTSIVLLLVFALFFSLGGSYLFFIAQKLTIEKQMNRMMTSGKLDAKNLTYIPISEISNFKWHRSQKEFEYKGSLFDIVSIIKTSTGTFYKCINDITEKRLIREAHKNATAKESRKIRYNLSNFISGFAKTQVRLTGRFTVIDTKPGTFLIYYLFDTPSPPPKVV
jgi:hypothetical protein